MTSLDTGRIATSGGARFLGQRGWLCLTWPPFGVPILVGDRCTPLPLVEYRIAGEALEYTGTALELLLGFLVAIAL